MRAAILNENNIVINIVEVEQLIDLPGAIDASGECNIGDYWDGSTFSPSTEYINNIKIKMWENIKNYRDFKKEDGVFVSNKWFHTDTYSRTQQLGLILLGTNIPVGLQWKTMDGSFITMDQTLINQIFSSIASSDINIFTVAETHRSNMLASSNPQNYDFSANWPTTYSDTI